MVDTAPNLERLAPVASSVVVFAHVSGGPATEETVLCLQESGLAVLSIHNNHRTMDEDLRVLVAGVVEL